VTPHPHARATDHDGENYEHARTADRRWRLDIGHLITLATTFFSALVMVLGFYYKTQADIQAHSEAIRRLESSAKTKESADSDLKVVITKLEELDKRLTERLDRIEANQSQQQSQQGRGRP